MNTKLIVGLGVALLMAGSATATTWTRSVVVPSTVDISGVGAFGISVCENLGVTPLFCNTGGVSAIIDISTLTQTDSYASGSCSVTPGAPSAGAVYSFSCGTDRDDDTFVTNSDANPEGPGLPFSSWDDDYVDGGSNAATTLTINCFRADLPDHAVGEDSVNDAGGGFDDVAIFVGSPIPNTNPLVGFANISLTLTSATGSCTGDSH